MDAVPKPAHQVALSTGLIYHLYVSQFNDTFSGHFEMERHLQSLAWITKMP